MNVTNDMQIPIGVLISRLIQKHLALEDTKDSFAYQRLQSDIKTIELAIERKLTPQI